MAVGVPVGLLSAVRPELAVAAVVAAAFIPLVLVRPFVGLCILVFFSFLENYSGMTGEISVAKIIGALLVLGWFATVATQARADGVRSGVIASAPALGFAIILLLVWASISLTWAESPGTGASAVFRLALNLVLFPVALAAIRTPRHVVWLFAVFIAGALTSVVLGMLFAPGADASDTGRLKGAGLNPNQLGALLIVAIVFGATFAASRRWAPFARILAVAATVAAGIALFMTLSRGALLGLGVALVIAPFAIGRGRRAAAVVLVFAALIGTIGWFTTVASQAAIDRITHPERAGGSGREDLWNVGWRMVEDRPIRGVGAGNFPVSSIHYLLRPGLTQRDRFIVDTPKVPHNIYLSVLSELGIIGLTLFALLIAICLVSAIRAAHVFAQQGRWIMDILARALFIALVGLLAADFFSSELYSKQLWLLLATAPAMLVMARRSTAATERDVRPTPWQLERARVDG